MPLRRSGDVPVGIVLCGGRSSRMGTDKALIGSPPWAHRVAAALDSTGCDPTVLVGGVPSLATADWPWQADDQPGSGPGAAVVTACRTHPGRSLVVAACDLPNITPAAISALLDAIDGGAEVAVYDVEGRAQWSLVALGSGRAEQIACADSGPSPSLTSLLSPGSTHLVPEDPHPVTDIDAPPAAPD